MKLLVIEDDKTLQNQLLGQLSAASYDVDCANDGEEGLYRAREFYYDLAIIDVGLPKISGVDIVKALRNEQRKLPVIMLTARSSWKDKVSALKSGADDYLVKPFQSEELLARIGALLRRSGGYASSELTQGPIQLNIETGDVSVDSRPVSLTALEYKLMHYFLLYPNRVSSKAVLAEYLYDEENERDSNVIEVLVARLRQKLDPDNRYKPIQTLRGRGYRLREQ